MRYVITGGSSFIGVALTEFLIKEKHEVYIVCRKTSTTINLIPKNENVHVILYDGMDDVRSVSLHVHSADVWIHLAWAGTGHDCRNDKNIQTKNINDSLMAVNTANKLGCKIFVDAGSQAEYGFVSGVLTEDTPCKPENEYGKAKLEFGIRCREICHGYGMKHIHLRILSVYGETDHEWTLVMSCIRKMLANEDVELSSCLQMWNFVYIRDAVKQIYLLIQNALMDDELTSEVYNIASEDTRKLKSFVEEMYELTDSHSKLLYGYYKPANVVSLNPDVAKTKKATGGFISDYSFKDVVNRIIEKYKNN